MLCLVAGIVLIVAPWRGPTDVGTVPVAAPASAAPSPPAPSSDAPTPAATPTVAPVAGTMPVQVALPDRDITAPIVPVGTDPQGGLVIPDPPTTVGWWTPSALPGGTAGTTILAGHVDSRLAGLGAFSVLRQIGVGERVLVRGTDGREIAYRIVARKEYVKAALPTADLFARGGPPRLVMITCGGAFDVATRNYEDNVVVYATPV